MGEKSISSGKASNSAFSSSLPLHRCLGVCYRGTIKARLLNAVEDRTLKKVSKNDSMGRLTFIRPLGEERECGYIRYFKGCLCYFMLALIMHSCCRVTVFHLQKFAASPLLFQPTLPLGLFT